MWVHTASTLLQKTGLLIGIWRIYERWKATSAAPRSTTPTPFLACNLVLSQWRRHAYIKADATAYGWDVGIWTVSRSFVIRAFSKRCWENSAYRRAQHDDHAVIQTWMFHQHQDVWFHWWNTSHEAHQLLLCSGNLLLAFRQCGPTNTPLK